MSDDEVPDEHVDLAVVGAGPAGLAAASLASSLNLRSVLIDDQPRPGGQVFRQGSAPKTLPFFARGLGGVYADPVSAGIEYRSEHAVWAFNQEGLYVCGPTGSYRLQARRVILATGAGEWVLPIPGWTLPGVVTAGGAQALLKTSGVVVGRRVAIAGTGPLLLQLAAELLDAGAEIAAVLEVASFGQWSRAVTRTLAHPPTALQGMTLLATLARRGVRIQWSRVPSRILGSDHVNGLEVSASPGSRGSPERRCVAADAVCLSHGLLPSIDLASMRGCQVRYSPVTGVWEVARDDSMRTSIHDVFCIGDGARITGARAAVVEGQLAACAVAQDLGRLDERRASRLQRRLRRRLSLRAPVRSFLDSTFRRRPELIDGLPDDAVLCRCEEVHAGTVREAVKDGVRSLRELRTLCRVGMGSCQGRFCAATVSRLLSRQIGSEPDSPGVGTPRPPSRPVTVAQIANRTGSLK